MNNKTTHPRATKYALGVAEGKSKQQAALDAGYSPSTAKRTNMIEKTEGYRLSKHIIEEATTKAIEVNREVQKKLSKEILKDGAKAIKDLTSDQKLSQFSKLDDTFQKLARKKDEKENLPQSVLNVERMLVQIIEEREAQTLPPIPTDRAEYS